MVRGVADVDSDLDLGLGVADASWPDVLADVPRLMESLGLVMDMVHHRLPEWGDAPHSRTFVQYMNGLQVDLVVLPAGRRKGRPPQTIVLYDPDGRLARSWTPDALRAGTASVTEWTFLGWVALSNLVKYVRRDSLWEALEQLHLARTFIWRLWAVSRSVSYPLFGLTSVLDDPEAGIPEDIEATVATLNARDLLRAASATAALLDRTSTLAAARSGVAVPDALAAHVRGRLDGLARVTGG